MKNFRKLMAILLAVIMLLGVAACSAGKTEPAKAPDNGATKASGSYSRTEPLKLSLAKLGNDGEYDNQRPAAHYLMDLVTKYSNGKITFDFYPNGQLGNESDMLDQVINGDLDMATLSDGTFAAVTPEVSLSLMPFLFNSSKEFYDVASLESGSKYQQAQVKAVDSYGQFKYIAPMNGLFRALSNRKHPVDSIDDLKDITMRIQPGDIYTDSYAAMGVATATIAFSELYTALQQGAVGGEDVSFPFYYSYKLYEVEPYTTEMRMFFQTINLIVSNKCWNEKFTPEDREIFMKAAQEAQRLGFQDQYKMDDDVFKLVTGLKNVKLTRYDEMKKEDIDAFRNAVKPVWEKYAKKNETVWNALQECLTAYRK
jgi:TRAP-type C4-dicarboxylate transport system substrate-binding protein